MPAPMAAQAKGCLQKPRLHVGGAQVCNFLLNLFGRPVIRRGDEGGVEEDRRLHRFANDTELDHRGLDTAPDLGLKVAILVGDRAV